MASRMLLGLLALALLPAETAQRPLGGVMLHQGIVMTLHGLMDHVDVAAVTVRLLLTCATQHVCCAYDGPGEWSTRWHGS